MIENAQLVLQNLQNVFSQTEQSPFIVRLSGKILVPSGPGSGLTDGKFVFFDPNRLPRFEPGTLSYEEHQFALAEVLPFQVNKAEIKFRDGTPELPALLDPPNLEITVSAALAIPPDEPYLEGRVDDMKVSFNAQGVPEFSLPLWLRSIRIITAECSGDSQMSRSGRQSMHRIQTASSQGPEGCSVRVLPRRPRTLTAPESRTPPCPSRAGQGGL